MAQKRYQEEQGPEGATPGRSPPRIQMQRELKTAMGHKKGKGEDFRIAVKPGQRFLCIGR